MNKATSTLIAAVAALALSGGAYAQRSGGTSSGGTSGSTASPATNQMNDSTSGYGTPGGTNGDAGIGTGLPNAQKNTDDGSTPGTAVPKSNNTLATPGVKSPVGNGS